MVDDMIKVKVKVDRQFFPKNKKIESGEYAIASVTVIDTIEGNPETNSKWGTLSIKGIMCAWEYGEIYTLIAKQLEDTQYGSQYSIITMFKEADLSNVDNQKAFLSRILTEKQINEIYNTFSNPISIIDNHDIEALCSVKGIGATTANNIISKYEEHKDYSTAYVELDKIGLTTKMIQKLCDSYGNPNLVVQRIQTNPYLIANEVDGVGWSKADEIALKSGYDEYSVNRVMAYITYYLDSEAQNNGNSYVYTEDLFDSIDEVLGDGLKSEVIGLALQTLIKMKKIWSDEDRIKIALLKYKNLEENIAEEIGRLIKCENTFRTDNWQEIINSQEKLQGWKYTEQQIEGIKESIKNNVVLITGYGGTGKTTVVNGMLKVLHEYNSAQCALSGKASVNLTEITGQEGYTIHRLLGYNPHDGYTINKENPLISDIVILDELSMVDEGLFYRLIQSIKDGAKLIMLGDIGQLQSIGVGNIINDLIESEVVTHINLTQIHRQAKKSAIALDSIEVWNGRQIIDKEFYDSEIRGELQDLELDIYKNSDDTAEKIMEHFKKLYEEVTHIMDLQVIVPMKNRGEACSLKLNNSIQSYIREIEGEPEDDICVKIGDDYAIFVGDKVMNVRNNYKTVNEYGEVVGIMNGNLGIVKEILSNNVMIVDFERLGRVIIPSDHSRYIELGYASTCHKMQGSGIKYIICGIDNSHYKMRTKEMIYTMMTRAKKYCVICAENKALRYAISHSGSIDKQTFLVDFLQKKMLTEKQI